MADDDSAAFQDKLSKSREELKALRKKLSQPEPFLYANDDFRKYVLLLLSTSAKVLETKSEVIAEMELLEGLVDRLEKEHAKAQKEFIQLQWSSLYVHRKRSMMHKELFGFLPKGYEIPKDFQEWIRQQLHGEDWSENLRSTEGMEEKLVRRAEAEGVPLETQPMVPENFKADDPDSVKKRFKDFQEKEFDVVEKMMKENVYAYGKIPKMCDSLKKLVKFIEAKFSPLVDDGTEVDEKSEDDSYSMHSVDEDPESSTVDTTLRQAGVKKSGNKLSKVIKQNLMGILKMGSKQKVPSKEKK